MFDTCAYASKISPNFTNTERKRSSLVRSSLCFCSRLPLPLPRHRRWSRIAISGAGWSLLGFWGPLCVSVNEHFQSRRVNSFVNWRQWRVQRIIKRFPVVAAIKCFRARVLYWYKKKWETNTGHPEQVQFALFYGETSFLFAALVCTDHATFTVNPLLG